MDTQKERIRGNCELLARLPHHRVVVGSKQLRKALESGKATVVFLAENADPAITEPIEALCQLKHTSCIWVPCKADLGRACGIEVGAAAAAAVD